MPLMRCSVGGKSGWKWGEEGKCYLSREDALEQAKAILASQHAAQDAAPVITSGELCDEEDGPNINRLALDVAVLTARFEERCDKFATRDDIAELRELILETRTENRMSRSAKSALLAALTTALSALGTALYAIFSN